MPSAFLSPMTYYYYRPRAKALAGIGGARSGRSRVATIKKRADLGSSCHVGHGSAVLVVVAIQIKKLRKPGLMSPTEKPARTGAVTRLRRVKSKDNVLADPVSRLTMDTHSNTPKMAVSPQGGGVPPLLARGRSDFGRFGAFWLLVRPVSVKTAAFWQRSHRSASLTAQCDGT